MLTVDIRNKVINTFGKTRLVQSESGAETVLFRFMDTIENPDDLGWSLAWANADGATDITPLTKGTDTEGHITLTWSPTRTQCGASGRLTIQIRGLGFEEDGETVRKYMTLPSYFMVGEDLMATAPIPEEEMLDEYLAKFETLYTKTLEDASDVIDEEAEAKIAEITAARTGALEAIATDKADAVAKIAVDKALATAAVDNKKSSAIQAVEDKGDYYEVVVNQYYVSQEVQEMKAEIDNLKKYLSNTDYMVIKCLERGIDMNSEYPTEYSARQNARNRINELESILN